MLLRLISAVRTKIEIVFCSTVWAFHNMTLLNIDKSIVSSSKYPIIAVANSGINFIKPLDFKFLCAIIKAQIQN